MFALAALVFGCIAFAAVRPAPLTGYRGDGTFQDRTRRSGPLLIRGYDISMPEFDLGRPFEAEYRVAGLPDIGKKCGIYLAMPFKPRLSDTDKIGGSLGFELLDSHDRTLAKASGKLGEYIWAEGGKYELYQLKESPRRKETPAPTEDSFFRPDPKEEYRLRVTYVPPPELEEREGYVWLRCGGSK
jgi:hypothetical protein